MDKIKFIVEEGVDVKESLKEYDISVYLNDVKMPHNIFNASEVLPVSNYHTASFDLFTCGCGVAGCAGFHNPVVQKIKNNIVTWKFPDSNDYTTDKKEYQFDEKEFKESFTKLINKMLELESLNAHHSSMLKNEAMYGSYDEESGDPLYEISKIQDSLDWYNNRYTGEQNFQDMLEKNYPELVTKTFKYTYECEIGEHDYNLGDIVCRLLNQYPMKAKEAAYLKKCKLAVNAIISFLNGEKESFQKIAESNYEKYDMSSHSIFYWDFRELKEEDFDFSKAGLIIKE